MMKKYKNLWIALGVLVLLTPLGMLATGTAWGEWGAEELLEMIGFMPKGMEKLSNSWTLAPLPDYSLSALSNGFSQEAAGYILSAIIGVLVTVAVIQIIGKFIPAEQEGANE
ncbi:MAG: cobalt/nickel transport system permease protein [Clostridiales bacterium]|jgi:ABC-type Fe3+ transport system permease subunit|nr:cobalt/nickel transport system permease protein [Clostridiales bacterium]MDK2933702.1 cobalt/nickel transport system permease protein [Clostridiales bacterium]